MSAEFLDGRTWAFRVALRRDDSALVNLLTIDKKAPETPLTVELVWRPHEAFPLALVSDPVAFTSALGLNIQRACEVWILALRGMWQLRETRDELIELKRCFDRWRGLPGRSRQGPLASDLVENPLRAFLAKAAPEGVRVGRGSRPDESDPRFATDLDMVFDHVHGEWLAQVRMNVHGSPVLAHLDVGARTSWDGKFHQDLDRIQRTINEARAVGKKTWTGVVCIGPAYKDRSEDIAKILHESQHKPGPRLWGDPDIGEVWPFVDVVVVPGMLLKKHDLFERPARTANRWPVMYPFPVGDDFRLGELWPLATARAFLASYLRKALGRERWEADAWHDWEYASITGGGAPVANWPAGWSVVSLRDDTPAELFHWANDEECVWQKHLREKRARCSKRMPYALQPISQLWLTAAGKQNLVAALSSDPRAWAPLTTSCSTLASFAYRPQAKEANLVASMVRRSGFNASAHKRLVKGLDSQPELEVEVMPDAPLGLTYDVDKGAFALPPQLAALRTELTAHFPGLKATDPVFQLPMLHSWLDDRCGSGNWSYADHGIVAKRYDVAVVFAVRNEKTNEVFVVVTAGDHAERIRDADVQRRAEAWLR